MAYTCPNCGRVSHHPRDAEERYCSACDRFEADQVHHEVTWLDSGREARSAPNPAYPKGMDVGLSTAPGVKSCKVSLPYPARRCGAYLVNCLVCKVHVRLSTAGRPDDPRSVTMACQAEPTRS